MKQSLTHNGSQPTVIATKLRKRSGLSVKEPRANQTAEDFSGTTMLGRGYTQSATVPLFEKVNY